jgi:DNA primase
MEYLLTHRGSRGQSFEYELLYSGEGESGNFFMMGLLDVEKLSKPRTENTVTTESSRGYLTRSRVDRDEFAGSTRPQRGGIAELQHSLYPLNGMAYRESSPSELESTHLGV